MTARGGMAALIQELRMITNSGPTDYTVNGIPGLAPGAGSPYLRSVSNINIPLLYPNANTSGVIPNFDFGGTPTISGTQLTTFAGTPYNNRSPVWNYIDNLTTTALRNLGVKLEGDTLVDQGMKVWCGHSCPRGGAQGPR